MELVLEARKARFEWSSGTLSISCGRLSVWACRPRSSIYQGDGLFWFYRAGPWDYHGRILWFAWGMQWPEKTGWGRYCEAQCDEARQALPSERPHAAAE